ncbi:MAG: hypothetical protein GX443_07060 [Deltaproteobacteria bacterium]|nr:hypothetical protein [Deltaproteobacteria bacterium]
MPVMRRTRIALNVQGIPVVKDLIVAEKEPFSPSLNSLREPERRVVGGYQKKIARLLLDIAGMEELRHFGTRRSLPGRVLETFRRVMDLFDESTRYLLGCLQDRGIFVRCGPQCPHCCYNMPSGLSNLELIGIYHGSVCTGMAPRLFRRCLEAGETWEGLLQRNPRQDDRDAPGALHHSREELLKRYLGQCMPCPFLHRSFCVVYPYRPMACRMHFSLSPPHWCNPAHFQNPHAVSFNLEPGECVQKALDRLDARFCLNISDIMICGFLELTVNIMQFEPIRWT